MNIATRQSDLAAARPFSRAMPDDAESERMALHGFIGDARRRVRARKGRASASIADFGDALVIAWLRALEAAGAHDYQTWLAADRECGELVDRIQAGFARTSDDAQAKFIAVRWLIVAGMYDQTGPVDQLARDIVSFLHSRVGPRFVLQACAASDDRRGSKAR